MLREIKQRYNYERGVYCNSTSTNLVYLDNSPRAYSYDHWKYMSTIGNKTIVNTSFYSMTTSKHQYDCLRLLDNKEIEYITFNGTLESLDAPINIIISSLENTLAELDKKIIKGRGKANEIRKREYNRICQVIDILKEREV